ncbi:MAG: 50S ribosomal protein L18 [Methylophilales bacterium]|jgi:large subunit ribosomal protein L18|nr:50S ribosomal protein L18 [Pseudomonadota bacterium]NQW34922.1 50S ribosomal protein L18 [Methylophilales bacterium]HCK04095.1 50S ribosomal protein L18 [Methylophilaceae bacterium]|tara:strand:+ start:24274 stop:24627 length:354 start_codon:yes stop_codon:yes gene_type:complete
MSEENQRLRRARKSRSKMAELNVTRLTVFRSNTNIYAQIIDGNNNKIIATASTLEAEVKKKLKSRSNVDAAVEIGKRIAEKAVKAGVKVVAFDRSGYKYHGRIKALADAARENGLTF